MYHAIVSSRINKLFDALNRGDYEPVLATCAGEFEHWFIGRDHALAGRRTTLPVTRKWYERLFAIFPNIHFDIQRIIVCGWPWDTTVTVEWSDSYTLLNGEKRHNCGVHVIRLKWGKGVSVRIYCDTQLLLENLAVQQHGGIEQAAAAPLVG
jgi:ketosteroid isomerase-like protein